MRSVEECLDELEDDDFAYTITLTEFMCELQVEGMLKELCRACRNENETDIKLAGTALGNSLNAYYRKRAETMSINSRTPFDNKFDELRDVA